MSKIIQVERTCAYCGKKFTTSKYTKTKHCSMRHAQLNRIDRKDGVIVTKTGRPRGRPPGWKLSEESKQKISNTMKGYSHEEKTKDKISGSLLKYFRKLNPLSEEIIYKYANYDDELNKWMIENADKIDSYGELWTDNFLDGRSNYEASVEYIESIAINDLDPERLLEIKEELEEIKKRRK